MVALTVVCALLMGRSAPVAAPADWSIHGERYVSEGSIRYSIKDAEGNHPDKVTWTIPDEVGSTPKAIKGAVEIPGDSDLVLTFSALPEGESKLPVIRHLVAQVGKEPPIKLDIAQYVKGGEPRLLLDDKVLSKIFLERGSPERGRVLLVAKLRRGESSIDGMMRVTLPNGLTFIGNGAGRSSADVEGGTPVAIEAVGTPDGPIKLESLVHPNPSSTEVPVVVVDYADRITVDGLTTGATLRTGSSVSLTAKVSKEGSEVAGREIRWGFLQSGTNVQTPTLVPSTSAATIDAQSGGTVKLSAIKPGRCELFAYLVRPDGAPDPWVHTSLVIDIVEAPQLAAVELPSTRMVIGQEMRARFRALASKQDGQVPFKKMSVQISLKDGTNVVDAKADDAEPNGSSVVLAARAVGSGTYTFKLKIDDASEVSGEFSIDVVAIADFSKIKVTLDPMDPSDVKRTFGALIERDYWVMTCHVVNKLDALENGQKVAAILVYGGSLDTAVEFEKRPVADKKAPWVPVQFDDVVRDYTPAHENDENRVPDDARGELLKVREARIGIDPAAIGLSAEKVAPVFVRVGEVVRIRLPQQDTEVVSIELSTDSLCDGRLDFLHEDQLVVGKSPGLAALRAKLKRDGKTFTVVQLFRVVPADGQRFAMLPTSEAAATGAMTVTSGTTLSLDPGGPPKDFDWTTSHERQVTIDPKAGAVTATGTGRYRIVATNRADPSAQKFFVVQSEVPPSKPSLPTSTYVDADGKLKQIRTRFRYKPVSMEMMLLGQDGREFETSEAGLRRTISVAQLILTALTGANILTGRGLELAVAGAGLMPAIADITVPNLAEKHRSAILTQGLRSLEEVPFGAELRRVVFYPKGEFGNLIPKHKARIATVDTSEFNISVAVIQRLGTKHGDDGTANGGGN